MINKPYRYYAIGDIHGRCDLTHEIISLIKKDIEQHPEDTPKLIFLGDYVDRGPSSKEVIDILISLEKEYECIFLKGNHEDIFLMFLEDASKGPLWIINGGIETFKSYGVNPIYPEDNNKKDGNNYEILQKQLLDNIPEAHLNFLKKTLQFSFETQNYLFVHAGVRYDIPLAKQNPQDLLWIREPFLSEDTNFGKTIVHGHSISKKPEIKTNRIGIDTGAYYTDILTCLVISSDKNYFLQTNSKKQF